MAPTVRRAHCPPCTRISALSPSTPNRSRTRQCTLPHVCVARRPPLCLLDAILTLSHSLCGPAVFVLRACSLLPGQEGREDPQVHHQLRDPRRSRDLRHQRFCTFLFWISPARLPLRASPSALNFRCASNAFLWRTMCCIRNQASWWHFPIFFLRRFAGEVPARPHQGQRRQAGSARRPRVGCQGGQEGQRDRQERHVEAFPQGLSASSFRIFLEIAPPPFAPMHIDALSFLCSCHPFIPQARARSHLSLTFVLFPIFFSHARVVAVPIALACSVFLPGAVLV